jgi:hypothetical protein
VTNVKTLLSVLNIDKPHKDGTIKGESEIKSEVKRPLLKVITIGLVKRQHSVRTVVKYKTCKLVVAP